jgi:hypothetical protein
MVQGPSFAWRPDGIGVGSSLQEVPTTRRLAEEFLAAFPALEPCTTVRLHPTPGIVPVTASKVGGEILWPADEDWPLCDEHQCPLVPVVQIRREDVPELGFVGETDLFQLLWCPTFHLDHGWGPRSQTYWRTSGDVVSIAPTPLHRGRLETYLGEVEAWYLPQACCVDPERVTELPHASELDPMLVEEMDEWLLGRLERWWAKGIADEPTAELVERFEGHPPSLYAWHFSVAPGTKVGGYVNWLQHPNRPACDRGHRMEHLLSVMNYESDPGDWLRWLPTEYPRELLANGASWAALVVPTKMDDARAVVSAHFICHECPERPQRVDFQST